MLPQCWLKSPVAQPDRAASTSARETPETLTRWTRKELYGIPAMLSKAEVDTTPSKLSSERPLRCCAPAALQPVSAHGLQGLHSECPFLHGTVRCDPYPGYVQGRNPAICNHGCVPAAPGPLEGETLEQRLLREALEFCRLYHTERGMSDEAFEARKESITADIHHCGRYEHTFDELQHGARVAWRNTGKCINRQVCVDHLR